MTALSHRVLPGRSREDQDTEVRRRRTAGIAATLTHVVALGLFVLSYDDLLFTAEPRESFPPTTVVFRLETGPGGGGGGGGDETPAPAPPAPAEVQGEDAGTFAADTEDVLVFDPTVVPDEPAANLDAPLEHRAPDEADRIGVLEGGDETSEVRGPGTGTGAGSGTGSGVGSGVGSGLGEGSGGGFGGGAYQIGSGVVPPVLTRQVEPKYTPEALQRQIAGDVVLEIIILADGTVGDVRVVEGLDPGLDRNAVAAARQWRFVPGKLDGTAVAVIAEIVMEFRLL